MVGPECCMGIDDDFEVLLDTLFDGHKTIDDPFEYRGLKFRPLADFIGETDSETAYSIAAHDSDIILIIWDPYEQEFELSLNGDGAEYVSSLKEFDDCLDRWVFDKKSKS